MKVLHVAAGFPSKERPYHQPFIKSQIISLQKEGINCGIYEIKGYKSQLEYAKALIKINKLVKIEKYDIIHAHYSYCGISAYLAMTDVPVILSLLGSDLLGRTDKEGRLTLRGKIDIRVSKFIANKVYHIIVKSEQMKSLVETRIPISIIPNGVNFENFKAKDYTESRNKLRLNKDDFIVLFLGNSNDHIKNFKLAKRGFDVFKDLKADPKIIFKNPYGIDENSVVEYMSASDVLLLTSFYEGSPNVIKEAMACNLPIISTDVGDVRKVINNTENCFLVPYSESEIADKLNIIYNNKSRSNGREKITHLDSRLIAKKIIDVYKSTV